MEVRTFAGKEYLVAPCQSGVRAAGQWRFWYQNAELYAFSQAMLSSTQSKVSFHSNGNWLLQAGALKAKLTPTAWVPDQWIQAISVRWLLWPGALMPASDEGTSSPVTLIEVPEGKVLSVHLMVSVRDSEPEVVRFAGESAELWRARLTDGRSLSLVQQLADSNEESQNDRIGIIGRAPTIKRPTRGHFYAEMHEPRLRPSHGNFVMIAPLGPGAFVAE